VTCLGSRSIVDDGQSGPGLARIESEERRIRRRLEHLIAQWAIVLTGVASRRGLGNGVQKTIQKVDVFCR
jgi:hypothetical protein